MQGMIERGTLPWFMVHRRELLTQTAATLELAGIRPGFIARGNQYDSSKPAQLVGIQYAVRRLELLERPGAMIVDEAHHAVARDHTALMDHWPDMLTLGLSATPERLDGRGLGDRFDVLLKGPSVRWLIDNNFLSDFRYFAPGKPDLSGVASVAGDYNQSQLEDVMGQAALIGDVVRHYRELAADQPGIVFAVTRAHSRMIAKAFQAHGIDAAHIDGSMNDRERNAIVEAFRAGLLKVLVNVDLFGEGFDVPGIVYCGLCRPTKSLSMWMQQCGRALRIFDGKEHAIICDHAGNTFHHGLPDDERHWSLAAKSKSKRTGATDAIAVHQCPLCYQVTASQRRVCPCGYVFTIRERSIAWEDGELFELRPDELRRNEVVDKAMLRKAEQRACQTFDELYDLAIRRGYGSPQAWAKTQLLMRKGKRPGGQRWRAR